MSRSQHQVHTQVKWLNCTKHYTDYQVHTVGTGLHMSTSDNPGTLKRGVESWCTTMCITRDVLYAGMEQWHLQNGCITCSSEAGGGCAPRSQGPGTQAGLLGCLNSCPQRQERVWAPCLAIPQQLPSPVNSICRTMPATSLACGRHTFLLPEMCAAIYSIVLPSALHELSST